MQRHTGEGLQQPVYYGFPKRQRCRTVPQQNRPCRHPSIDCTALAQRLQPTHHAPIWRPPSLPLLRLPILVDNVNINKVRKCLEAVERSLCQGPSVVRLVRFEAVHVVHGAVKCIRLPDGRVQATARHAVRAQNHIAGVPYYQWQTDREPNQRQIGRSVRPSDILRHRQRRGGRARAIRHLRQLRCSCRRCVVHY